jgi:hypothetical protein
MNLKELVGKAKAAKPESLELLSDAKAILLMREAFKIIKAEISATDEGMVSIPGLGLFRVRQVEAQRDGSKTIERRTIFKLPRPRAVVGSTEPPRSPADAAESPAEGNVTPLTRRGDSAIAELKSL